MPVRLFLSQPNVSGAMKRLFDIDPLSGTKRTFIYDESADAKNFVIETEQETTPIVEANKLAFNDAPTRIGQKEELVKVASIPLAIFFDLQRKGITRDPVAFKKWLNDPDNRAFRTRPGTV